MNEVGRPSEGLETSITINTSPSHGDISKTLLQTPKPMRSERHKTTIRCLPPSNSARRLLLPPLAASPQM